MSVERNLGFTLVELMVVIACMMLILLPTWKIFHQGTKTSRQGILQIETVQEGRRILKQISNDLKQSCWVWQDTIIPYYTLDNILQVSADPFPNKVYKFLSFPILGSAEDAIPKNTERDPISRKLWRKASRITYKLEASTKKAKENYPADFPIFNLVREERFNPKFQPGKGFPNSIREQILSERVLMFDIFPKTLEDSQGTQQQFFWVTLQLVDTLDKNRTFNLPPQGKRIISRSKDLIIADFFDIVSPEYFAAYRQMAGPRIKMASDYNRNSFFDAIDPENQK